MEQTNSIPKPTVQLDGDQYHAHFGEAYPEGISGWGHTEEEAIEDFESNYQAAQIMQNDHVEMANEGTVLADDHGTKLVLVNRTTPNRDEFALSIQDEVGFTGLRITKLQWEAMKVTIDTFLQGGSV